MHFHESWAREAALELENAGVKLCVQREVHEVGCGVGGGRKAA